MPTFKVNFEIYCARCGSGMCSNGTASVDRHGLRLDVEPCEKCLSDAARRATGAVAGKVEVYKQSVLLQ